MRILILTQFFAPEASTAPMNLGALATDLRRRGHEVTVLTGFPNHPFGKVYDGYRQRLWFRDEVDGVQVLRVPLYPDHSLSAVHRALNYSSFALSASLIGSPLLRKFSADVIFVYLPPLTIWLPLRILRALYRAPAVCWMTDMWPDGLVAVGTKLSRTAYRTIGRLEKAVYEQLDVLCVNSPGIRRKLIDKGLPEEKIDVVVDWADENIFGPEEPDLALAHEFGMADKFNVVYGGNMGPAQGLTAAVEAAALLSDVKDFQLVLIGDGEEKALLEAMVVERGLDNVRFVPRQPITEMRHFFALADVLLMHLKSDPLYELQIPSKTMAYLACGRPILCAVSGDAAGVVTQAGAGICTPPGDVVAMAEGIRRIRLLPEFERQRLGARGREAHLEHYTRTVQVARLENALRRAAGST